MRSVVLLLVAMCAACDGISIGDPGQDSSDLGNCTEETYEVLSDLSQPAPGFFWPPSELLEAASRRFGGTLELRDGREVPVSVKMTLDENSVRAIYRLDFYEQPCPHWLTAKVELVIDAGTVLSGRAQAAIQTPDQRRVTKTQISSDLIPFEDFESSLSPPEFKGEVGFGPALSLSFTLADFDTWQADFRFAAVVADNEGGFKGSKTQFKALGKAELNATDVLDSGVIDAGAAISDNGSQE